MLLYTGGSPCSNDKKVRAATAIRFVCDSNVFEHGLQPIEHFSKIWADLSLGTPQLIAQLPPDSEWPCGFVFEWRTYVSTIGKTCSRSLSEYRSWHVQAPAARHLVSS
jgi:cation-dependent mannose-6-phosphate receptor